MNYWIWAPSRQYDSDVTVPGTPKFIAESNICFDDGIKISTNIPTINIHLDKTSQGRMTDELIAQGTTGRVFNSKIREVLKNNGANNIDYYSINVINDTTNEIHTDWKIANIIGEVACIDFDKSDLEIDEDDGEVEFINKLVIDNFKAYESSLKVFRLAEFLPLVIVDNDIKSALEKSELLGFKFYNPENFVL